MIPRCESDGLVFDAEKGVVRPGQAKPWLKRAPLGPHPLFPKITNSLLSPRIIHGWLDVKQCIWVNLAVKASVPNTEVLKLLWMRPHFFLQCFFEVCKTSKRIQNTCLHFALWSCEFDLNIIDRWLARYKTQFWNPEKMSCDRNLTAEEWLEIVHGFWQVGRDRGFGPSGWISRLNVTITNVSKVFVFSVDSVPCFISMC